MECVEFQLHTKRRAKSNASYRNWKFKNVSNSRRKIC